MTKRRRRRSPVGCEVLLSPLIDCVFLLLIFFLVTSMIKRFERQIPVNLSDATSAISDEASDDSYPIGVRRDGLLHGPTETNSFGVMNFEPLPNPDAFLRGLIESRGASAPVTVNVERGTPFQSVIKVQDRLEILGFKQIRFRVRDVPFVDTNNNLRKD